MIKREYQVTLISAEGKYKPVSCIVSVNQEKDENFSMDKLQRKELIKKGTIKIAQKRYWTNSDLKKYGYVKAKVRLYDKEKIQQENALRYEQIKEQHYQDGSWQRPAKEH